MAKSSTSTKPRISVRETFSALQHRNYRIWFIGQLISLIGTWMQSTAQQYLIYDITNSTVLLGFVTFMAGVPTLVLTLLGGVIADRFSRRNLIIVTQAAMMLLAFILAGLVFLNLIQYWHIIILATLLGIANAIEAPSRMSFVTDLVDDRKDISNAIAMNAAMFNMAVVIGPAVSGMVYFLVGPGWCFIINGFSFVAVIIALLMIRIPPIKKLETHSSIFRDIGEGIRYVFAKPLILWLIITLGVVSLIGFGFVAQSPAWAKGVLHGDERTNGWMLTMRGIGSLIGALVVAALGRRKIHGKLWAVGSIMLPMGILTLRHHPLAASCQCMDGSCFIPGFDLCRCLIDAHRQYQQCHGTNPVFGSIPRAGNGIVYPDFSGRHAHRFADHWGGCSRSRIAIDDTDRRNHTCPIYGICMAFQTKNSQT